MRCVWTAAYSDCFFRYPINWFFKSIKFNSVFRPCPRSLNIRSTILKSRRSIPPFIFIVLRWLEIQSLRIHYCLLNKVHRLTSSTFYFVKIQTVNGIRRTRFVWAKCARCDLWPTPPQITHLCNSLLCPGRNPLCISHTPTHKETNTLQPHQAYNPHKRTEQKHLRQNDSWHSNLIRQPSWTWCPRQRKCQTTLVPMCRTCFPYLYSRFTWEFKGWVNNTPVMTLTATWPGRATK